MITTDEKISERRVKGIPVCRGVAIGRPFVFHYQYAEGVLAAPQVVDVTAEIKRYRLAVERCRGEARSLQMQMAAEHVAEGVSILEAHLQMLVDPLLTAEIEKLITHKSLSAEKALQKALSSYERYFEDLADPFFRERFKDIQEVARRLMGHLRHQIRISMSDIPAGSVVFTTELSAYEAAEADPRRICAFVTASGGLTTHAAIVAKAKGIPYVARVAFADLPLEPKRVVIVDARTGEVIIKPHNSTLVVYRHVQQQINDHALALENMALAATMTGDGVGVRLSGNVEAVEEVTLLHQYGGAGVGLLRSESLFFAHTSVPSEEEQYRHYRFFVEQMHGLPLVIRTFDLGGDKNYMNCSDLPNKLEIAKRRALRCVLQESTIFREQLRAILRAAVEGEVSILFPMVSSLTELREAKAVIAEVTAELLTQGYRCPEQIRVGCMVEVPSAALIADLLAQECDFLSIGTNDLAHYTLAIERTQHMPSLLQAVCHPGLLRLIKMIVHSANQRGIPVSVCGEAASDPRFTMLLLGLGLYELSVACRYIPLVKNAIRHIKVDKAIQLAEAALQLSTAAEVQELLTEVYRQNVPGDCFYNY